MVLKLNYAWLASLATVLTERNMFARHALSKQVAALQ